MANKSHKITLFTSTLHNYYYPVKKSLSMSFKRMSENEAIQISYNSVSD